jgi:hypothetical protein
MFRILAALFTLTCAFQCTDLQAQGRCGNGHYHRAYGPSVQRDYPSTGFGITIGNSPAYGHPAYGYPGWGYPYPSAYPFNGFDYGYDPYRYGSFQAPDLLDDPYFRARNRHNSRFPGR